MYPIHNKNLIVYNQGLHIKKLCSKKDTLEKHLESLHSWFDKRRYPKELVDNQIWRILESKVEQLSERSTRTVTGVPLVLTDHLWCHNLSNTIRKRFIYLYAEDHVKKVFTPASFVSFRSDYSLRSDLVCIIPLVREKGPSCCGKSMCEISFNIQETGTAQSFVTKEVYKINHHFHCNSKCIIYLISCKVCGLQYIGSMVDRFCLRYNNYICSRNILLKLEKQNSFSKIKFFWTLSDQQQLCVLLTHPHSNFKRMVCP